MSRQLPPNQRPRVLHTPDNPYQGTTTSTLPLTHTYQTKLPPQSQTLRDTNYHLKCTGSIRGAACPLEHDACFTDEPFAEHSYYDFYDQDHGYQTSPNKHKDSRTEYSYSDDSGSTRLPFYDYDDISNRRHSRNNYSERSFPKPQLPNHLKDFRKVYPNDVDRISQENRYINEQPTIVTIAPRRGHLSTIPDRSESSMSSAVPSAVIHGCGGKCQTFENVCYYFLQVTFTMGILIGISLGIAGWVLRKSAARNLQVLLYIGAMLSLVCALLLGIQCNARNAARMRQRALRNAKRAHIPLDVLPSRMMQQQQPLMENGNIQRGIPVTLVQIPGPGPILQVQRSYDRHHQGADQQGVPWWRRKDLR